jgi:hypothetical protein
MTYRRRPAGGISLRSREQKSRTLRESVLLRTTRGSRARRCRNPAMRKSPVRLAMSSRPAVVASPNQAVGPRFDAATSISAFPRSAPQCAAGREAARWQLLRNHDAAMPLRRRDVSGPAQRSPRFVTSRRPLGPRRPAAPQRPSSRQRSDACGGKRRPREHWAETAPAAMATRDRRECP